jgi:hypothetical protein
MMAHRCGLTERSHALSETFYLRVNLLVPFFDGVIDILVRALLLG